MLYRHKNFYIGAFYVICFFLCMCAIGINKTLVFSQEITQKIENSVKQILDNITIIKSNEFKDEKAYFKEIESRFFIRPNTIIRTGESRALGAKYLNESRMSSNHECLIWCFETPTCNAVVYEEKNLQSCYLFDCGSPANPLCKFTSHMFFTSSILKISQHSYELSQWGKQVKQERFKTEQHDGIQVTSPVTISAHTLSSTSSVSPTNALPSEKKDNICHHYQFKCVNSSECIAIYNVCDGIPQCPDGSDESDELKCPTKDSPKETFVNTNKPNVIPHPLNKTPVAKEKIPSPKPSVPYPSIQNIQPYHKSQKLNELHHNDAYNSRRNRPKAYSDMHIPKSAYQNQMDDSDGLGSPFIHKHSQFMAANDPHVQSLNRWVNDYDPYPPHSTSLEQQYIPYDRMDDQYLPNQLPADYDSGKGFNGYHPDDIAYWPNQDIIPDTSYTLDDFPQTGVQNMNKEMAYPEKENRESYVQQIARTAEQFSKPKMSIQTTLLNQPTDFDDYKLHRYPVERQPPSYLSLENSQRQHYSGYQNINRKQPNTLQNMDDSVYNNDDIIKASLVNQLPKKIGTTSAHVTTLKPTEPSKNIQKTVLDFKMSVAELYQSSNTHTHESNSAILALVVGVIISFLLIILLACRIRVLRRRMSRKGRALAHDADYLVNGMYL